MKPVFDCTLSVLAFDSFDAVPQSRGVVRFDLREAPPYVGQARNLKRRLKRLRDLFGDRAVAASYQPVGSAFEARAVQLAAARDAWPGEYRSRLRTRLPALLKTLESNQFPRLAVTNRISGAGLFFGPFRSRLFAERFEESLLDFYQVRRCSENLEPSPEHPGCVFGEIGKCLRPCQAVVGEQDYRSEFGRLVMALESGGEALVSELERRRDDASARLEFENAKELHSQVSAARKLFAGAAPAADLDHWHGIIVQRGAGEGSIALFPVVKGFLQSKMELDLVSSAGDSLDLRLREAIESSEFAEGGPREREDSAGLVSRWLFSSWREGEFLSIPSLDRIPYRRLVNAVSRVAQGRRKA